jgi:hypothetical protein
MDYSNIHVTVCKNVLQRNCNNQIGKLELCEIERLKTTAQFTEISILFMSPGYTRSNTTHSIARVRGAYKT